MPRVYILPILCIMVLFGCNCVGDEEILELALQSEDIRIKRVMENLDRHEVQIRYTQIHRKNDSLYLTDHDFQVDSSRYFYPASTVKFPAAVATLEKLNSVDSLNLHSVFYVEGDTVKTTFAAAIKEIFAVSDNEAHNRLIEFLGFDGLNQRMMDKKVNPIRISHRLSTVYADDVVTKPLVFYMDDSTTSVSASIIGKPPSPLTLESIEKGKGFFAKDSLYSQPFDFSLKNHFPITAQSALLKRIVFPELFPKDEQFNLSKEQFRLLRNAMGSLPYELDYDRNEFYDSYVKFFMFGDTKEPMPKHIKIYNKVGYAYGTLTDCAYIKDTKNDIDFMLVATILVNNDSIFNDDEYEYEEIGIPFLAQLGREIHQLELNQKK